MAGTAGDPHAPRNGRRERLRAETREEAKRLALRQLSESGPWGLSINAIARQMGVTGPALYRYFSGRDELLSELVTDAYEDLADTMGAAAQQRDRGPRGRLRAVAAAYRDWALSQPHRYLLLFGAPLPHDQAAGTRGMPQARRAVDVLVDVFAALLAERVPGHAGVAPQPGSVGAVAARRLALAAWTRLHGAVSLEIEGHLAAAGADPTAAYRAEVDELLDAARRAVLRAG